VFAPHDASSGVFQPLDDECCVSSIRLIFFRQHSPSPIALWANGGEIRLQQRLHFSCPQDLGPDLLVEDDV